MDDSFMIEVVHLCSGRSSKPSNVPISCDRRLFVLAGKPSLGGLVNPPAPRIAICSINNNAASDVPNSPTRKTASQHQHSVIYQNSIMIFNGLIAILPKISSPSNRPKHRIHQDKRSLLRLL